jgi:hypothetical protein
MAKNIIQEIMVETLSAVSVLQSTAMVLTLSKMEMEARKTIMIMAVTVTVVVKMVALTMRKKTMTPMINAMEKT